ncbi:FAD-binding oxidoreductase [Cryomorpha ignava]|uniref:FAD-binding oxidoreductase n=1 Tax=Cryomorpha ignava TaxID=101383 RepID=A0A7K3WRN1_9FLAO|nr:FAD-binding oxidoreductase [Cryomorpha ignava]NEN24188.1 FAD-binding oxidoreductase [Cryomorpha ignava]
MKNFSYWERKHFWNYWDFTIIGSGITGLTGAIFIKRKYPKAKVTILERGMLPSGASTKNAGFACFGSMSEILDDLETASEESVFNLLKNRFNGLLALRRLLSDKQTGYMPTKGFEIFTDNEREIYENCMHRLHFVNETIAQTIGHKTFENADGQIDQFGFKNVNHIISNAYEGTIDTGLMMKNLIDLARSEGVEIYNGVEVSDIDYSGERPQLNTNYGEIKTGTVVVATNGFAGRLFPERDIKPARAQVIITKPIKNLKIEGCFHHNCGYNYFRNIDDRILLGGGRHLNKVAEETYEMGNTLEITDYLSDLMKSTILPEGDFEIDQTWSGIMGVGQSKEVILEKVGASTIAAFRFGGMGIALGTYVGKSVGEMV